jgi:hypothetical protein
LNSKTPEELAQFFLITLLLMFLDALFDAAANAEEAHERIDALEQSLPLRPVHGG